ncbi:unnamed protein product, partial [marine sediment metagenome]
NLKEKIGNELYADINIHSLLEGLRMAHRKMDMMRAMIKDDAENLALQGQMIGALERENRRLREGTK